MVVVVSPIVHTETNNETPNLASLTDLRRAVFELKTLFIESRLIEKSYDKGFLKLVNEIKALRSSLSSANEVNRRLSSLIYNSYDAMILVDLKGSIIDWNLGAERMYGYTDAEALGKNILDITNKDEQKASSDLIKDLEKGIAIPSAETKRITKDGRILDMWLTIVVLRDSEGRITSICTTERDITRWKRAEDTSQRLSALIENSSDAIITMTDEGIITDWNHGAELMYGYSVKEVSGRSVFQIIPVSFSCDMPYIIDKILNGEKAVHFKTNLFRKDGSSRDIVIIISAIKDMNDRILGISWTARDITDIKSVKNALIKAYDVNNPIKEHTIGLR